MCDANSAQVSVRNGVTVTTHDISGAVYARVIISLVGLCTLASSSHAARMAKEWQARTGGQSMLKVAIKKLDMGKPRTGGQEC
jgi:hypothetical protein